jgi:hypothetical protein
VSDQPLAGGTPLIDVHAHFYHAGCGRADWEAVNAARLRAGDRIGVTYHVASILGSWGHTSPTYFPSPADCTRANDALLDMQAADGRIRAYATINPNDTAHALREIERCAARGAIGVKLAASRRADDPLLDPIVEAARAFRFPMLHHIWQHRRRDWPGQEASDGVELCRLAARFPDVFFILAHIGGGGDYAHTFAAVRAQPNILLDLSGSGIDRGMLDGALGAVGPARLLWGCDVTMETGLAKLRALEVMDVTPDALDAIRGSNAARIFPPGSFPAIEGARARRAVAAA